LAGQIDVPYGLVIRPRQKRVLANGGCLGSKTATHEWLLMADSVEKVGFRFRVRKERV
jgi:hypothetical protein